MKKTYTQPSLEVVMLDQRDMIATSGEPDSKSVFLPFTFEPGFEPDPFGVAD